MDRLQFHPEVTLAKFLIFFKTKTKKSFLLLNILIVFKHKYYEANIILEMIFSVPLILSKLSIS